MYLTESTWLGAREKALRKGLSASEYIEQLIRKDLDECDKSRPYRLYPRAHPA